MPAMAAAPPPRFDSVLSFGDAQPVPTTTTEEEGEEAGAVAPYDSEDDDAGFEFAFAPPLAAGAEGAAVDLAPADDLFAHGRIVPAYPVFDRHLLLDRDGADEAAAPEPAPQASTAPPSPDTYCAWAPRSAPGSPARDPAPFPKSASTGESRRFWGLRGLVSGGRSHSDGKEKFVFLQPASTPSKMSGTKATATKPSAAPAQKQSNKKKGGKTAAAVTEMDMATAHKLFYGKQGAAGALPGDRKHPQQSYLPYRPGIVGFFATAHALGGRSHHPY